MLSILCLAFVSSLSSTPVFVPEHVERIVKARLLQQLALARTDIEFQFNDSGCPNKVHYHFTGESLVTLGAEHSLWPARLELNLTEILEGKKFDFAFLHLAGEGPPKPVATLSQSDEPRKRKWLPWLIAAVGIGAGAYLLQGRGGGERPGDGGLRLQQP